MFYTILGGLGEILKIMFSKLAEIDFPGITSGLSYFRILTICLLLVYFVSAAGCHCFDLQKSSK